MSEKKHLQQSMANYHHQKGHILDNALFALVKDPLFRQRIEKKRKGKGSYQRHAKHRNQYFEKPDHKILVKQDFMSGLFIVNDDKFYQLY